MRKHARTMVCALSLSWIVSACQDDEGSQLHENTAATYNCQPILACDAKAPDPGALRPFNKKKPGGNDYHFGRDQYWNETEDQWVIGKFKYGNVLIRNDLSNEEVDVYVLRGCGQTWEKLGTALTTSGKHETIEGVEDDGGRVFFKIPEDKRLGVGRHRIRLVVAGDHTAAELFAEVIPQGVPLFVSDVDGTLTTSELEELGSSITGATPKVNDFAAETMSALSSKGFRPVYVTARAEPLTPRTRDFVKERFLPAGRIETSLANLIGLSGGKAVEYKTTALGRLQAKGFDISYVFGNTATDAEAYDNAGIPAESRYFYKYDDKKFGGQRIDSYRELNKFATVEGVCQ